jgi:two-component system cell cycle sensor histidine kinase/response regulator CckA
VRESIHNILRSREYHVLEAEGYEDALAIIQEGPGKVDLLLIDVSLPGKHGFSLAQALRRIDPNLKLIFMSAPVGAEWSRYHGVSVTDVHFLPKPFSAAELLDRVKYVLAWRAPFFARGGL